MYEDKCPLDLTKDSHTQHKELRQNMARVFPFILRAKHKTLHVKQAWAKLENSVEKKSARTSINRARQIYIVNPTVHSILTLHINII